MGVTKQIQDILASAGNHIHGVDSQDDDMTYTSIIEWKEQIEMPSSSATSVTEDTTKQHTKNRQKWYKTGYDYYEDESNCPATVNGVLGGFASISNIDLEGSINFMRYLKSSMRPELMLTKEENDGFPTRACECGAGIGRVSKGLLLPLGITQCDLVEPSPRLISSAPEYLGDQYASQCRFYCSGLQEFVPKDQYYDVIWIQWVIGYLTDDDLVDFLRRCAVGLRKGGVVVIKDNTCQNEAFIVDRADASSTRSFPYILAIADLAGLRVVYQKFQEDFPPGIFPVPIVALEPKS